MKFKEITYKLFHMASGFWVYNAAKTPDRMYAENLNADNVRDGDSHLSSRKDHLFLPGRYSEVLWCLGLVSRMSVKVY
jgi:hypothetical protein